MVVQSILYDESLYVVYMCVHEISLDNYVTISGPPVVMNT